MALKVRESGWQWCAISWTRTGDGFRWRARPAKAARSPCTCPGRTEMARILIVGDEPDIAMGLQEDLEIHGHEVEVAADGDAALRRGRDRPWDVILLDLMLPRRDGF